MPKLDGKAMPALTDKAKQHLKLGLPTVLDCMYNSYHNRAVSRVSAGNSISEKN